MKTGSETYVGVANHEVEIKTSALGSVGITFENDKWTAGTATSETGLATAADVATEIANDELVIAAALNDHEARIQKAESDITTNPVPFILVNADPSYKLREGGCLADIVPTIIELMGMEQPVEMTGKSLLVK